MTSSRKLIYALSVCTYLTYTALSIVPTSKEKKMHTHSKPLPLQYCLCGAEWDMCVMMSFWEAEGWGECVCGGDAIEMLMSLHSGGDSWRGTEDGVMSLQI